MRRLFIPLLSACLAACASVSPNDEQPSESLKEALTLQILWARQHAHDIDDLRASAEAAALALAERCDAQYQRSTEAFAATLKNEDDKAAWRQERTGNGARIADFLPIIEQRRKVL